MNPTKFTITTAWSKCIAAMPDMDRLAVYDAIFKYVEEGEEPTDLSEAASIAFMFIRCDIDTLHKQRQNASAKRAAAANARWSKKKTKKNDATCNP